MELSTLLLQSWQVKQDLWKVWPAARIISAMKTDLSHLGEVSWLAWCD